jgi:hypothetical protein
MTEQRNYSGGGNRTGLGKTMRIYLKNNIKVKGLGYGLSGRAFKQGIDFKHKKGRKEGKEIGREGRKEKKERRKRDEEGRDEEGVLRKRGKEKKEREGERKEGSKEVNMNTKNRSFVNAQELLMLSLETKKTGVHANSINERLNKFWVCPKQILRCCGHDEVLFAAILSGNNII